MYEKTQTIMFKQRVDSYSFIINPENAMSMQIGRGLIYIIINEASLVGKSSTK